MLKFVLAGTEKMIGLILEPENLAHIRAKPLDNGISIDGTPLGRPDLRIMIVYMRSGTQARKVIKQDLHRNSAAGSLSFTGLYHDQKMLGIVLTEPNLVRFEADPLGHYETFDDPRYGIPNLHVMLSYSDSGRRTVRFMRDLGVSVNQFANDPDLRPLWERYEEEMVSHSLRMARFAGMEIPADELTGASFAAPETSGMKESAILATRGQDIAYFRAHPGETEYFRRTVPGELPPEIHAEWVKVINVPESHTPPDETVRLKIPMNRIGGVFVEARGGVAETTETKE